MIAVSDDLDDVMSALTQDWSVKKQEKLRPLIREGRRGLDPHTNQPSQVRVGATLNPPSERPWVVPLDLIQRFYRDIARRIRRKTIRGSMQPYVTDPSPHDHQTRTKYFYVEGAADEIAGPFGFDALKVFLTASMAGAEGQDTRVYIVSTTTRALKVIADSPHAEEPEPPSIALDDDSDPF